MPILSLSHKYSSLTIIDIQVIKSNRIYANNRELHRNNHARYDVKVYNIRLSVLL